METLPKEEISLETLYARVQRLEDEILIRDLTYSYADAANRVDATLFASLWTEEGQWLIGPPINLAFQGRENIVQAFRQLLGRWDFFVQQPVGGNLTIEGDRATAYFYVNEVARGKDGIGNYNLAQYADQLVKREGKWYFQQRDYRVIYLDQAPLKGTAFHPPSAH
jgi:ketosteroid isomerase-like protein